VKIRQGFVSNSSSSSFVVISNNGTYPDLSHLKGEALSVCGRKDAGEREFGWQQEEYSDWPSKLNFAFLQTTYMAEDRGAECLKMLEDVIFEETGAVSITWAKDDACSYDAYIDHQSNAGEGENTEIFNSKDDLRDFIFCSGSYLQCGNDNESYE